VTAPRRTLLSVARRAHVPIGYPCRGEGVCGRCAVRVLHGADRLAPMAASERDILARQGAAPDERLACMAEVVQPGPIEIAVGGGVYRLPWRGPPRGFSR